MRTQGTTMAAPLPPLLTPILTSTETFMTGVVTTLKDQVLDLEVVDISMNTQPQHPQL